MLTIINNNKNVIETAKLKNNVLVQVNCQIIFYFISNTFILLFTFAGSKQTIIDYTQFRIIVLSYFFIVRFNKVKCFVCKQC